MAHACRAPRSSRWRAFRGGTSHSSQPGCLTDPTGDNMNDSTKSSLLLAGRFLLALMFILAGFGKLANAGATAQFMASGGLPNMPSLAMLVGLFEVLAGIALIV